MHLVQKLLLLTFLLYMAFTGQSKATFDPLDWNLWSAATLGDLAAAQNLLAQNHTREHLNILLLKTAQGGHNAVVRYLVERGADVNTGIASANTPLLKAIQGKHLETVRYLIDEGTDLSNGYSRTHNPLLKAVSVGCLDLVQLLVQQGADIFNNHSFLHSPLLKAVENGHQDIVRYLTEQGADINNGNTILHNPLIKAIEGGHVEIANYLIAQKSADIKGSQSTGHTPLLSAIKSRQIELTRLLINKKGTVMDYSAKHRLDDNSILWFNLRYERNPLIHLCLEKLKDCVIEGLAWDLALPAGVQQELQQAFDRKKHSYQPETDVNPPL